MSITKNIIIIAELMTKPDVELISLIIRVTSIMHKQMQMIMAQIIPAISPILCNFLLLACDSK